MTSNRRAGHRVQRRAGWRWVKILLGVAFVALIAQGTRIALSDEADPRVDAQSGDGSGAEACGEQRVTVVADPRISAAIEAIVAELPADECATIGVQTVASGEIAQDVARATGRGIGGTLPDIWIADSSVWTDQAGRTTEGADRMVGESASLASTPVVLAVAEGTAQAQGWPATQPEWASLVDAPGVRAGLADLRADAATLGNVAGLSAGGSLAQLAQRVSVPDLGEGTAAELVGSGALDVMVSTEAEVAAAAAAGLPVVASYDPALGRLDFPMTQIAPLGEKADPVVARVMAALAEAVASEAGQEQLAQAHLRGADGVAVAGATAPAGVDFALASGEPTPYDETAAAAMRDWEKVSRRSRLLLLFDLSGSMAETLPGSSQTRAQAGQQGVAGLITSAAPDSEIGLWGFTTEVGNGDYEVFVPAGPLSESVAGQNRRAALLARVADLEPVLGGSTSLYDSVAAAYRTAGRKFAFGRFNAVVVVTDGRNEDDGSLTLEALLDRVRQDFDGTQPVRVITIAYGEDADRATLRRIADATGGRSYVALSAAEIAATFAEIAAEL